MTAQKFRKKPVVIEAVHLTDDSFSPCIQWILAKGGEVDGACPRDHYGPCRIGIKTLEGVMTAVGEDWIIRGVKGEFYPCKPDIFEATYEVVQPEELK